jgi:hypothetical protein
MRPGADAVMLEIIGIGFLQTLFLARLIDPGGNPFSGSIGLRFF